MKVRIPVCIPALLLSFGMLPACFGGEPASGRDGGSITIRVVNGTSCQFREIYLSGSASAALGSDVLGGTKVLEAGGACDVTLGAAGNYNLQVVGEENALYRFEHLPLEEGMEVEVVFGGGGKPAAELTDASGSTQVIDGALLGTGNDNASVTGGPRRQPTLPAPGTAPRAAGKSPCTRKAARAFEAFNPWTIFCADITQVSTE